MFLTTYAVFKFSFLFPMDAQIKTESGAKVKASKTGIYKKWKERSHRKVSLKGTSNEGDAAETTGLSGSTINF